MSRLRPNQAAAPDLSRIRRAAGPRPRSSPETKGPAPGRRRECPARTEAPTESRAALRRRADLRISGVPPFAAADRFQEARTRLDAGDFAAAAGSWLETARQETKNAFTLQLAIACQEESVKKAARRTRGSVDFFMVPFSLEGRSCYRLCWGAYASQEEARAGKAAVPAFFLDEGGKPVVVSLGKAGSLRRDAEMRRMAGAGVLGMLLSAGASLADTIHLKDGRSLEVEGWRYQGDQIVFEIAGGSVTIPRSLVERIEASPPPAARAAASASANPAPAPPDALPGAAPPLQRPAAGTRREAPPLPPATASGSLSDDQIRETLESPEARPPRAAPAPRGRRPGDRPGALGPGGSRRREEGPLRSRQPLPGGPHLRPAVPPGADRPLRQLPQGREGSLRPGPDPGGAGLPSEGPVPPRSPGHRLLPGGKPS